MVGAIVAVLRGGPPRLNAASPWEASRRPLSVYNFNSRLDDFVCLAPFFSLFLALVALSVARKQLPTTWLFQVDRRENIPAFEASLSNELLNAKRIHETRTCVIIMWYVTRTEEIYHMLITECNNGKCQIRILHLFLILQNDFYIRFQYCIL